ncbi:MAG TPA: peptidase, partial [Thermoanaerobaculia bacterium]
AYAHGDANTELFPRHTDPVFDPIAAAMTSADITISALLDPARAARLTQQDDNVTFRDVTDALLDATTQQGRIPRATRTVLMTRLALLARDVETAPQVRAEAFDALRRLSARLTPNGDEAEQASRRAMRDEIGRFLERPEEWKAPVLPAVPPGPPI